VAALPSANEGLTMGVTAVIGAQWGDEGKGKLVHLLSQDYDLILRYQGGSNAGHTVQVGDQVYKFKLVPSGILHPGKLCLLCDGVVVNVLTLAGEIAELTANGGWQGALKISRHAHLVLPYHTKQDEYFEDAKGHQAIGTTRRGIGPAYADKYFRVGLRGADLLKPGFKDKVKFAAERKNVLFGGYYQRDLLDPDQVWAEVEPTVALLAPLVDDTIGLVRQAIADGRSVMCEGAQGTLLDIDYGTYPFVTSSHPVTGGALLGTGVNWRNLERVIGVTKAYTTRVGAGPFPTEDEGAEGSLMREAGVEYGTVTGRPRRCGWLDLVLLRYAAQLNGFTEMALTKTDVLDSFAKIKVCVGYERDGRRVEWPDLEPDVLAECRPVYEELPGWQAATSEMRSEGELPGALLDYVRYIEDYVGVRISIVSVGPKNSATVHRG
jgi:adenylosuccinate synthase